MNAAEDGSAGTGGNGFNPSLRTRLLLLVLLGVVLPLGILGIWVSTSARRTGIELVHARARAALDETVLQFEREWVRRRSLLLDLSESGSVARALGSAEPWSEVLSEADREDLLDSWEAISPFVVYVELIGGDGGEVGRLPDVLGPNFFVPSPLGTLDRTFPVLERFSGDELGSLGVRLRVEGLLPPGFLAQGVGGSALAIFDPETDASLVPTSIEPELFGRDRFTWLGDEWVTEDSESTEPRLRFVLASPIEPVTAPYDRAARRGAAAILLAIALSFTLVSLFSRRLLRPLDRLVAAAGAVGSGDLSTRVEESGPPEVRDTARAFNAMSAALDETLRELSRKEATAAVGEFAADLAHEVRNPLTAIRTDLQRAERKLADDPEGAERLVRRAVGSVDRLNATVSDFLRVARSGRVSLSPCDLRGPIARAVRASEPHRVAKGCVLDYEEPREALEVMGDPDALEGLFLNLLLNAVEAVDPGAPLGVRLYRGRSSTAGTAPPGGEARAAGSVVVEVWDRGPGIPADIAGTLFDPFVTSKAEGTGLGLAIASRVARAHGSELEWERRSGETRFRITLTGVGVSDGLERG